MNKSLLPLSVLAFIISAYNAAGQPSQTMGQLELLSPNDIQQLYQLETAPTPPLPTDNALVDEENQSLPVAEPEEILELDRLDEFSDDSTELTVQGNDLPEMLPDESLSNSLPVLNDPDDNMQPLKVPERDVTVPIGDAVESAMLESSLSETAELVEPSELTIDARPLAQPKEIENIPSLMMKPREQQLVQAALQVYLSREGQVTQSVDGEEVIIPENASYAMITLSSLLYVDSTNWGVWINGRKYTPTKREVLENIYLDSVAPDNVSITLSYDDGSIVAEEGVENQDVMKRVSFNLSPNQSFYVRKNLVLEGRRADQQLQDVIKEINRDKKDDEGNLDMPLLDDEIAMQDDYYMSGETPENYDETLYNEGAQ